MTGSTPPRPRHPLPSAFQLEKVRILASPVQRGIGLIEGDECLDQVHSRIGCTFPVSKSSGWDQRLQVASGGRGLVGHAGAILLRRCADRTGLTGR